MFKSITRNSQRIRINSRSIHTIPKLELHDQWKTNGLSNLFSSQGYTESWINFQNYLLTNLTLLTNGTGNETKHPFQILLNTAKQSTKQHIFHFASMAFNNHFFYQQLTNQEIAKETKPSRFLMEKLIHQDIDSLESLKLKMNNIIMNSNGQGVLFLVESKDKSLQFLNCSNDGTPFYYGKNQILDLNGGIDEHTFKQLENLKQRVKNGDSDFNLPILAISYWDIMYIHDFGINGKSEYLNKVWDYINWDIVNKRLFQV
ncbi:unnamed protein product [Candida verbasci]|uniref:Manganese/iron superoxide dismutase C-terminal domain-containing protein n=1 Tax=Candida verbasci TaxID=1227364 RepID=A0A9W4TZ66_9ASCO|nr:unnamed protein product [Candida verbasci]